MILIVGQRGLRDEKVPVGYNWLVILRQRENIDKYRKEVLSSTEITPMRVFVYGRSLLD